MRRTFLHFPIAIWLIFFAYDSSAAQDTPDTPDKPLSTKDDLPGTAESPAITMDINAAPLPDPAKLQPGAGLALRQTLAKQIVEAQKRGVGVKAYCIAFADMEESVSKGAIEADIKKKVFSIASGLHSQLRQSVTIKRSASATARNNAAGNVDRRGSVLKTRSDGFLYAGDNANIFMKDKGVMRQQSQIDLIETVIRQKLRENPIPGVNPNDPRPLRDDPRVKKMIH